ncbi:MAG: alpha-amylase family glycosyl hydrolase [Bacteroidales bacterium]|nr:alpha-amylase family glycosyl hydrolase [Bacteroidales bacterium]
MKKIILFSLIIVAVACSTERKHLPQDHFVTGLAFPLRLDKDQSEIILTDFVPYVTLIDSVLIDGKRVDMEADKNTIAYKIPPEAKPLMEMRIWNKGSYQSVLVMKSRKVDFLYSFDPGNKVYKSVRLAAEFNGWTPTRTQLKLENGNWTGTFPLNPGRYQYQVVTDDHWRLDPANPDSVDNNAGGFNSVMKVGLMDKSNIPFLYTVEYDKSENEINVKWTRLPSDFFVFWQNILLDKSYLEIEKDELGISIPKEAAGFERSYIRVYSLNYNGISNELLIPLQNRNVVMDADLVKRSDKEAQIIYNVFIDRFYNGNPANDEPINNPALVLPKADYFGGDIAGITARVKEGYFNDLGVNTIWISPVVLNPKGAYGQWNDPKTKFSAYHGYWPISFTLIDPRMGTPADLKELVREAHARGINVLLDFVAHHVHVLHPYYIEHPNWTTSLYLPDGTMNTEKWDEYRLTTWFDVFLPTLDLQQPEVTEMLSDSATWWIKKYELDGFRHDATKHVPEIFWRTLTKKLKQQVVQAEGREIYQIGETYGGPELISSYVNTGMLDGQFDFNVYDAAIGVFAREADPFTNLDNTLQTSFDFYGNQNLMGYITGNQDRGRFVSYAGGDLKFGENAKAAGWTRDIEVGDTLGYRKLSMLTAFNMTIPGLPVIYYGDEIGLPGGNDPDSRRMMKFDGLNPHESSTKATATKLAKIRKENLSLIYGNFTTLQVDDKTYAYARQYFDNISVVIFNKDNKPANLEITLPDWMENPQFKSNFGNNFNLDERKLSITLAPWSFEIMTGSVD